jgi:hypothetical protein
MWPQCRPQDEDLASGASVFFEDERQLRARGDAVTRLLLVPRLDLVSLKDAVAGIVDREQVRIYGVALRMANALRLFEANFHRHSFRVSRSRGRDFAMQAIR